MADGIKQTLILRKIRLINQNYNEKFNSFMNVIKDFTSHRFELRGNTVYKQSAVQLLSNK